MWSNNITFKGFKVLYNFIVAFTSLSDGYGLPDGWLWDKKIPAAL